MKLASQLAAGQERRIARAIGPIRAAVRKGRSRFCCFDQPIGTTRLDLLGPNGMIGGSNDGFLCASVPTLRLWSRRRRRARSPWPPRTRTSPPESTPSPAAPPRSSATSFRCSSPCSPRSRRRPPGCASARPTSAT